MILFSLWWEPYFHIHGPGQKYVNCLAGNDTRKLGVEWEKAAEKAFSFWFEFWPRDLETF